MEAQGRNSGFGPGTRNKQLDALRAVACLMVIGYHVHWIPIWSAMGWSGVDLFFVLSGFLISGLLFREHTKRGNIHIGHFLARRGFKIYPAYYTFLIGSAISLLLRGFDPSSVFRAVLHYACFVQSYTRESGGFLMGHLWSVAVEEHFYILLPVCMWLAIRKKAVADPFTQLPVVCGLVMLSCLAFRCLPSSISHRSWSHFHLDGLALGVALSYFWHFRPGYLDALVIRRRRHFLLAASLMLVSTAVFLGQDTPVMFSFGITGLAFGYGGLLVYCLKCVDEGDPLVDPLASIGRYSYTIYLVHLPLMALVTSSKWFVVGAFSYSDGASHSFFRLWGGFVIYAMASVFIGVLFSRVVEIPALRVRERVFPLAFGASYAVPKTVDPAGSLPDATIHLA